RTPHKKTSRNLHLPYSHKTFGSPTAKISAAHPPQSRTGSGNSPADSPSTAPPPSLFLRYLQSPAQAALAPTPESRSNPLPRAGPANTHPHIRGSLPRASAGEGAAPALVSRFAVPAPLVAPLRASLPLAVSALPPASKPCRTQSAKIGSRQYPQD